MGCCMSGSRTANDNGNDGTDLVNSQTTDPAGTVIGDDGSAGGTIPYYGTPGGSMTGGNNKGGPYTGATVHSLGTNYNPTKVSSDYISQMKSQNLDALSASSESNGNPAAINLDNNGYYAYGKYQMNSGTGSVNEFLAYEKVNNPTAYSQLMAAGGDSISGQQSSAFQSAWSNLANTDSSFSDDQTAFIKTNYYDTAVSNLENQGVDVDNLSTGAKQLIWSTSVQYGANSSVMTNALANVNKSTMSSNDFINTLSDYKESTVSTYFSKSSSAVQSSVASRFANERIGALNNS